MARYKLYVFPPIHEKTVKNFLNWKGLSVKKYTLKNIETILKMLSKWAPDKPLEQLSRTEIEAFLNHVKNNYSYNTFQLAKRYVKAFYRYLEQPEKVEHIKLQPFAVAVRREDLLTQEEIKLIMQNSNLRYRALFGILYEAGLRIREALSLTVDMVEPTKYGFRLNIPAEGGESTKRHTRVIPILYHAQVLAQYLETRPKKRGTPLFPMGYWAVWMYLKKLTRKLGIDKNVHPHLFRHQRYSELAKKVSDEVGRVMFGWRPGTKMPSRYAHLSPEEVEAAILAAQGVEIEQEATVKLENVACPRCQELNLNYYDYCYRCGYPLNSEVAIKILEHESEVQWMKEQLAKITQIVEKGLKG